MPLKLERNDGSVLDCMTMPLPDGATMLTFQDVTDTENVERALRERNEALEAADQIKVDFVHHVSYELRSPLTNIIGFAHFLGDPVTGPLTPKQAEYLGYITASTNALLAIINNILDLATIDAGAMTLNLGAVDIRKTIEAAAEGIQDRLATDRIELKIDVDPSIGSFTGDERRVVQVLYQSVGQCRRILAAGRDGRACSARRTEHSVGLHRHRFAARAFRPTSRTRCSTGSRAIPTARGIAAPASACRWCAPSSNCTAARCASIRSSARARPSRATFRSTRPRIVTPRNDRLHDILAGAIERDGDGASDGRPRIADRPRRRHHAFGRSRRRQDRRGAGDDPLPRRRRRAGGAKPDLHAGAELRPAAFPLVHADLYRVNDPAELEEIGLSPLPEGTVTLIEWPERAADALPEDRIDIALSHRPALGSAARAAEITGYGKAAAQVARLKALRQFLDGAGYLDARRRRMAGDASTRSYARLIRDDGVVILMNSPRRPDGPAIYDGKSYSAAVHLAEDVKPFVAIADGLREHGFSAPSIHHADLEAGFLITEDFGSAGFVEGDPPAADRGAL